MRIVRTYTPLHGGEPAKLTNSATRRFVPKKGGLTTGITALEGLIASRFVQPLAKRPNDKRTNHHLVSTKRESCLPGQPLFGERNTTSSLSGNAGLRWANE
jgi:hypothetical protein